MIDQGKHRIDQYGTVYEYSEESGAYIAIGKKLPGETDSEAIERLTTLEHL
jgi:hypothetical protein